MNWAAKAGVIYFAGVFALGFVLGTVRVFWVLPKLGEWGATLVELPLMLALSWVYCGWLVRRWFVPATLRARLLMGLVAFILLMIVEILLGTLMIGRSLVEQLGEMTSGPGLAGLMGQIAFAAFPLVQLRRSFEA